jgi:hypothetical protein
VDWPSFCGAGESIAIEGLSDTRPGEPIFEVRVLEILSLSSALELLNDDLLSSLDIRTLASSDGLEFIDVIPDFGESRSLDRDRGMSSTSISMRSPLLSPCVLCNVGLVVATAAAAGILSFGVIEQTWLMHSK